ncbi:Calcium channel yvc1 [Scheffersomyces spartinae]|uniref:Calcium channel yvc1 n=1 Tax=Scheffersomyces spartinae TaxID=45513 RepID=A0A9P7V668_9ASCO|nr:Calcium channel yvc1 [Scheffersomyces spartinae]KAG7192112.1 Calcium channel yvc1 [Scheffersomyces spartinae]
MDLEQPSLLDRHEGDLFLQSSCPNPRQVFKICQNLKVLIDRVIPITFDQDDVTSTDSAILNDEVVKLTFKAAGGKGDGKKGTSSYRYRAALVFCLLKVCDWYWQQADIELSNNSLYLLRAVAAQTLAGIVIEETKEDELLFLGMLCHRYSICIHEEDQNPISALELAVDMHSTIVMGSSGYQRCIQWLWRGWIVQSTVDPHSYVMYKGVDSSSFRLHFNPARIKTPAYQNLLEIFFSIIFLVLYTFILNGHGNTDHSLTFVEYLFYWFTIGSIVDEIVKIYHVGYNYLGFWNVFNDFMYSIISVAFVFRMLSVTAPKHHPNEERFDQISFRVLSCAAPLMWSRLLLYLDAQRFVGALIVVVKTMMKESILFFFLLAVVIIGFLQGLLGLDAADGTSESTKKILVSLIKAVVGDSNVGDVANLVPPYASILYYSYNFILAVILMNILIALYSTAYGQIVENATAEYFALVAHKTLRYIRAPDVDLYVPPFNIFEILLSPFYHFLSEKHYKTLNYYVMVIIYAPMLCYITVDELSHARRIQFNRFKGLPDDANEINTEWDLTDGFDVEAETSWDGIRERNSEVTNELRLQREGENEDPEFNIDSYKFEAEIDKVVQPVVKAKKVGIKWELYDLYEKLDKLTTLVESVVAENQELKKQLNDK